MMILPFFLFPFRLPKFKAEVKKMIIASLPSAIAAHFPNVQDQTWRSYRMSQPDVFLSKAENTKSSGKSDEMQELYGFPSGMFGHERKPTTLTKSCSINTKFFPPPSEYNRGILRR